MARIATGVGARAPVFAVGINHSTGIELAPPDAR